jgi:hypothetical protein
MGDLYFFDSQLIVGKRRDSGAIVETPVEELLGEMARHRITRGLCYGGSARDYHPAAGNVEAVELTRGIDSLSPLAVMLPLETGEMGSESDLVDFFRRSRVKGAVVFPDATGHNFSLRDWCSASMLSFLENLRMPLFIPFNRIGNSFDAVAEVLASRPKLPVVLWNLGYGQERFWYPLMDRFANLHLGNSISRGFLQVETAVKRFGADRLVVESGFPELAMGAVVLAVVDAAIADSEKHLIAHGNLERLTSGILL